MAFLHSTQPLDALQDAFAAAHLRGAVVRGPDAGTPLGIRHAPAFADRVRASLDPDGRFR